jgi:hypothetical protein
VAPDGSVSFSDAPAGPDAERVRLPSAQGSDERSGHMRQHRLERALEAYATERRERAERRAQQDHERAERTRMCLAARDENARLEQAAHLYYRQPDGTKRIIDGAEHAAVMAEAKAAVEAWCG